MKLSIPSSAQLFPPIVIYCALILCVELQHFWDETFPLDCKWLQMIANNPLIAARSIEGIPRFSPCCQVTFQWLAAKMDFVRMLPVWLHDFVDILLSVQSNEHSPANQLLITNIFRLEIQCLFLDVNIFSDNIWSAETMEINSNSSKNKRQTSIELNIDGISILFAQAQVWQNMIRFNEGKFCVHSTQIKLNYALLQCWCGTTHIVYRIQYLDNQIVSFCSINKSYCYWFKC